MTLYLCHICIHFPHYSATQNARVFKIRINTVSELRFKVSDWSEWVDAFEIDSAWAMRYCNATRRRYIFNNYIVYCKIHHAILILGLHSAQWRKKKNLHTELCYIIVCFVHFHPAGTRMVDKLVLRYVLANLATPAILSIEREKHLVLKSVDWINPSFPSLYPHMSSVLYASFNGTKLANRIISADKTLFPVRSDRGSDFLHSNCSCWSLPSCALPVEYFTNTCSCQPFCLAY